MKDYLLLAGLICLMLFGEGIAELLISLTA